MEKETDGHYESNTYFRNFANSPNNGYNHFGRADFIPLYLL
jgi:hypothetical protein